MSNYYDDEFEMRGSTRKQSQVRNFSNRKDMEDRKESKSRKMYYDEDEDDQDYEDQEWEDDRSYGKMSQPCNCRKCQAKQEHMQECHKCHPCPESKVKKIYYPIWVYPPCYSKDFHCPNNEEKKHREPECKEECKPCPPKDECKHDRDRFEGIDAFAYVYSLASTIVVVGAGTDIVFTNNGPLQRVTHLVNTSQVAILRSGTYEIYYGVNAISGTGASIGLAVNGVVNPGTVVSIPVTPSETSGKVILELRAGDILTLRNTSLIPITLAVSPSVGAQLTLIRLDDLDKNI